MQTDAKAPLPHSAPTRIEAPFNAPDHPVHEPAVQSDESPELTHSSGVQPADPTDHPTKNRRIIRRGTGSFDESNRIEISFCAPDHPVIEPWARSTYNHRYHKDAVHYAQM